MLMTSVFWDHEYASFKDVKESTEEELFVYLSDQLFGDLDYNILKLFINESKIFVMFPLVVKMFLHLNFHLLVDRPIIELLKHTKELRKLVSLVKTRVKLLEILQDLDKVAHHQGKDHNSKQKCHRPHHSLCITFWYVITQSYSRERCE